MTTKPRETVDVTASRERDDDGARADRPRPRWARPLRRLLLCGIALLFLVSIPWYRGDTPTAMLWGLPDWVTVAILCYALAAILNSAAWMLTDIPEADGDDEAQET